MFKSSQNNFELQNIVKENIEYSGFFSFEMKFSWGQDFALERILKFSIFLIVKENSKALPRFFLCIFSSLTCLKKPVFSKWDHPGKELSTSPSVIFDLFPQPTGLRHRSSIMEGPVVRPVS